REARFRLSPAVPAAAAEPPALPGLSSLVAQRVTSWVQQSTVDNPISWYQATSPEAIDQALRAVEGGIREELTGRLGRPAAGGAQPGFDTLDAILARESVAAGVLGFLHQHLPPEQLESLLTAPAPDVTATLGRLGAVLNVGASRLTEAAL